MKTFKTLFKIIGWFCIICSIVFVSFLMRYLHNYFEYSLFGDVTLLDVYVLAYLTLSFIVFGLICLWLAELSKIRAKEEEYYEYQLKKQTQELIERNKLKTNENPNI